MNALGADRVYATHYVLSWAEAIELVALAEDYFNEQTAIAFSPLYGDSMRSCHFPLKFAPARAIWSATPAQIFRASFPFVSIVTSTRECKPLTLHSVVRPVPSIALQSR